MYKLLIVDDNVQIRFGIKNYLQSNNFNFDRIEMAEDGLNALDMLSEFEPDIILSDIKMPRMNGIDAVRELKRKLPESKVVFFSAYDELNLLKSAFKLDAIDYILKPIDFEELHHAIQRAIDLLNKEKADKQKLMESVSLLRNKTLLSAIQGDLKNKYEIEKRLLSAEISIEKNEFYLVSIMELICSCDINEVENTIYDIISKYVSCYVVSKDERTLYLVFSLKHPDMTLVYDIFHKVHDNLYLEHGISTTIAIGEVVGDISELNRSFLKALELLYLKLYKGKNTIITMNELNYLDETKHIDNNLINTIYNSMGELDLKKAIYYTEVFFNQVILYKNITKEKLQNVCINILVRLADILVKKKININNLNTTEEPLWEGILGLDTVEDIRNFVLGRISTANEYIKKMCENEANDILIERIKKIICENYSSTLSLQWIADKAYLSKSYLCTFFKNQTNETIGSYIQKVRVEKAKYYLENTDLRISEICEKVGYDDQNYFCKVFKNYTSIIPTDYRKKYRS